MAAKIIYFSRFFLPSYYSCKRQMFFRETDVWTEPKKGSHNSMPLFWWKKNKNKKHVLILQMEHLLSWKNSKQNTSKNQTISLLHF